MSLPTSSLLNPCSKECNSSKPNPGSEKAHGVFRGTEKKGWVGYLPDSWVPYIQLSRLNPPVWPLLIYFSHLYGLLYAAIVNGNSISRTMWDAAVLLGGTIFFSNAAHTWDDIVDVPIDMLVERTCRRPLPRKAVSMTQAIIFTITQALCALTFFAWFPYPESPLYALPSIIGTAYYPYAKRHTNFPQVVLGSVIAWGVFVGALAGGMKPSLDHAGMENTIPLVFLFMGCVSWNVIYDTVYAHLDREHDIAIAVGSTAVFFGNHTKLFVWVCWIFMSMFLSAAGTTGGLGYVYLGSIVGSLAFLGLMIIYVDLKDPSSISWWFLRGYFLTGGTLAFGLFGEYLLRVVFGIIWIPRQPGFAGL